MLAIRSFGPNMEIRSRETRIQRVVNDTHFVPCIRSSPSDHGTILPSVGCWVEV